MPETGGRTDRQTDRRQCLSTRTKSETNNSQSLGWAGEADVGFFSHSLSLSLSHKTRPDKTIGVKLDDCMHALLTRKSSIHNYNP